jgi:malonate transporter
MIEIVTIVLPFFGLIGLGYAAGTWRKLPGEGLAWLDFFVFYLALPALFFQLIAETPIARVSSWSFVMMTTFGTYCTFAIAFSIAALINRGHVPVATIQGLVGSYANTGFMAPGLTVAAFGPAAAIPTALIFSFDSAMLFTLVPLMMALGASERADPAAILATVARSVFLHPFILATIAGYAVAASGLELPSPIAALLTLLRSAAVPCALFALGVGLALRRPKPSRLDVPLLVGIKLFVHPLVVYLLLSWIGGFNEVWVHTAVLMAALPPAVNVFVMARQYGFYVEGASNAVLIGTLASVVTVTAILSLILTGTLPTDPFR